ncbi:MAG TPA: hypothetical protein PLP04_11700 [Bryobacteraceae bacterium]|nr:hypothetical protein [Bryobacteraceae bacterium]HOL73335.1 hypothetical protein [Bryobacteraceae bacterium]HPQ15887.1 hypothetical protein [Bryobacteraceae bacterium]
MLRLARGLEGRKIRVRFAPDLRASNGRLFSGGTRGEEVHAGSFLRRREIVLDSELLKQPAELGRICIHELFHFAWLRAGNAARRSWQELLAAEIANHAKGELGWSAEDRKLRLTRNDWTRRTLRWREYACESFCDSAAWLLGGVRRHEEFTLAPRFQKGRRRWFLETLGNKALRV